MIMYMISCSVKYFFVFFSRDLERAPGSAIKSAKRMINENVFSWNLKAKLNDSSATCRNKRALNVFVY